MAEGKRVAQEVIPPPPIKDQAVCVFIARKVLIMIPFSKKGFNFIPFA